MSSWWDASDAASLTIVSSAVSSWADQVAAAALAQGTAANRPAYGSRFINGVVVPDFDGSNDRLDASGVSYTANTNWSFCCVGMNDTPTVFQAILASLSGGGRQVAVETSRQLKLLTEGAASSNVHIGSSLRTAVPFAFGVAHTHGASDNTLWTKDGSAIRLVGINQTHAGGGVRIGCRSNATNFYNGALAELILFTRALSSAELLSMTAWMMAKWGIRDRFSRPEAS